MITVCTECGKEYKVTTEPKRKSHFCSKECRNKAKARRKRELREEKKKQMPVSNLSLCARHAAELGISYGNYMARELCKVR